MTILGKILKAGAGVIKTAVSAATGINLSAVGASTPYASSAAAVTATVPQPTAAPKLSLNLQTGQTSFMDWIKQNWWIVLLGISGLGLLFWIMSMVFGGSKKAPARRKSGGKTAMQKQMAKVRAAKKK